MISEWLINDPPLLLLPRLATVVGVNEAILIQQVHFWMSVQRVGQEVDGRRWVYNSVRSWREENFPFWSESTIKRTIANLEGMGILLSAQLDDNPLNHTKWYSLDYDALDYVMRAATSGDDWFKLNRSKQRLLEAGLYKNKDQRERRKKKEPIGLSPPDQPVEQETASDIRAAPRPIDDEKERLALALARLAEAFSQQSGIPLPAPSSKRDWGEYNVRWMRPLKAILEITQTVGNATVLIHKAVDQMRADDLTIASPQSIEKVAVSIFAKEQGEHDDVYW